MPLFECEDCGMVDNTALTNFWGDHICDGKPALCSQCDPRIGKWHGQFKRMTRAEHDEGGYRKVEYPAAAKREAGR
jgi:hypothetical protein